MRKMLSFDDVLIAPDFSEIKSRADVDLTQDLLGLTLKTPFISSNMDTVTEAKMAVAMRENGGVGALHRFMSIEENVEMFRKCPKDTIVSIGLGKKELERAEALYHAGAINFLIDVAHGASMEVVRQNDELKMLLDPSTVIVGNFATKEGIRDFYFNSKSSRLPTMYKIGIGGGSACTTRVVTGCGVPTLGSILDCAQTGEILIADGGIRNSGDAAKALAAGASLVMCGRLFAGTDESPGEVIWSEEGGYLCDPTFKKYRGSASSESYEVQGKTAPHRTAEGDSYLVPYVGKVSEVIDNLNAGIKSACSYVGAKNLSEFRERAEFVEITSNGVKENGAHGKS